jgi:hypothetical protein
MIFKRKKKLQTRIQEYKFYSTKWHMTTYMLKEVKLMLSKIKHTLNVNGHFMQIQHACKTARS